MPNNLLQFIIRNYTENQIPVLPLIPNEKSPLTKRGFYDASIKKDQVETWWSENPDANIGIVTGSASGLVVIDVDIKNNVDGLASLAELCKKYGELPETLTIESPSGGFHYYFQYSGDDISCSASKLAKGIDVRANGGYIVGVPSKIGDRRYRKHSETSKIEELPIWLRKLLTEQKTTITDTNAETIPKGERNNSLFKYVSGLRGMGLDEEEAAELLISKNEKCCSPPLGTKELFKILQSVYGRYPAGGNEEEIPEEIQRMNEEFFMAGGAIGQIVESVSGQKEVNFLKVSDFKIIFGNQFVDIGGKRIPLPKYWLEHPKRKTYKNGVCFDPSGKTSSDYYNFWQGFSIRAGLNGNCETYLSHIHDNIANGDQKIYEYLISWMADSIQNPSVRPGTSLVLRGGQGTGKGIFVTEYGKLFGKHFVHLRNTNQIIGQFNSMLEMGLLVFADEAVWAGDKKAHGSLKGLITENLIEIRPLYRNAYQARNFVRLISATNDDWASPADLDDRRLLVLEVGDKHKQDHDYFGSIIEEMENGGREALFDYLMNYDLTGVNLRKVPKTDALWNAKLQSMDSVGKYWLECLSEGMIAGKSSYWSNKVPVSDIYENYINFVKNNGNSYRSTPEEFGKKIKKLIPDFEKKKVGPSNNRYHAYVISSLDHCREVFCQYVGHDLKWI